MRRAIIFWIVFCSKSSPTDVYTLVTEAYAWPAWVWTKAGSYPASIRW